MSLRCNFPSVALPIVGVAILVIVSLPVGVMRAQERKAKPETASSLILGTVASERGTTASIPIYFKPGKDALRSLHLEVDFVSNSVKFAKADKGLAAQTQDYELTVKANELAPDDKKISHTRLSIDVSLPDSASGKSLPEGLWAFLNFTIPSDAKPFSISLNPIAISAQNASKKPIEVASEAGKIIVSVPDEPLAGCFFFSH